MNLPPLHDVCRFAAETRLERLAGSVLAHAKQVLLDTCGVMLAGSRSPHISRLDRPLSDPQIAAIAKWVETRFSEDYEALRPEMTPAKVTVHLEDGRQIAREVKNCLGDPGNPMSPEAVRRKLTAVAEAVVGAKNAARFVEEIRHVESRGEVCSLLVLLARSGPAASG